jgi:hypothetical protein
LERPPQVRQAGTGTRRSAGQKPLKISSTALKNNADIRAEAKVREAEAELYRVRHQIVAKVTTLKRDIATAKRWSNWLKRRRRSKGIYHPAAASKKYTPPWPPSKQRPTWPT